MASSCTACLLKMGSMCHPAMSVTSCQPTPHKVPEKRRPLVRLRFNILQRRIHFGQTNELGAGVLISPRKHVRDARDINNIESRALIKFIFLQGKAPNEIHAILTETLACFLPGRAKNLSAPLHIGG